ncbi:DUF2892 domain-containing protein [Candidatus Micrarchaeota archaeon]|nr:DUF2892 domain-containing protein [Candidatus Micrarchaeota archaeon]
MKFLEKNVGKTDRIVRVVLGVVVAALGFTYLAAPLSYVAYLIALILLFTGAYGTCGLYTLVGINTSEKPAEKPAEKK